MLPAALTIAGSDPSGGAGIQADLKTFHQLRVYGMAAVAVITVQNTRRVSRVVPADAILVGQQIDAVLEDIPPNAVKTGALGNAAIIEAIALRRFGAPLIVDPVMIGKHGTPLMDSLAVAALREKLLPCAAVVTPNLPEAAELAGMDVRNPDEMKEAARRIAAFGVPSVLIKGGHLAGDAVDILYYRGAFSEFRAPRIQTQHTHGTGCTYSAAIAAFLARGESMENAVRLAKRFITEAIRTAPGIGAGRGPLNHWALKPGSL